MVIFRINTRFRHKVRLFSPFKDIDMVSSSTISSVSVINSVKAAADAFNAFMQIEVEESS
jgi:hypothetical protein